MATTLGWVPSAAARVVGEATAANIYDNVTLDADVGVITIPSVTGDDSTNFVPLFILTNKFIRPTSVILLTTECIDYDGGITSATVTQRSQGSASIAVTIVRGALAAQTVRVHFQIINR
jgi:hypothetical protein